MRGCHRGPVAETWSTVEQIAGKLAEFEAALGPQWERPLAWGLVHEDGAGRLVVDRAERGGQRHLPALAVMATVLGYGGGTSVTMIDAAALQRAIGMLAPAEACTAYEHVNLRTWRRVREEIGASGSAVVVFIEDVEKAGAETRGPHVDALLRSLAQ